MTLFKYFKAARAIEVLQNSELYLVNSSVCNDPFEFTANADLSNATIEAIKLPLRREEHFLHWCKVNHPGDDGEKWRAYYYGHLDEIAAERMKALPQQAQWAANQMLRQSVDKTFVAGCFSRKSDSLLMWAHYAENHTGIVIEFDMEQKPFADLSKWLRDVKYGNTKPLYKHNYANSHVGFEEQFFVIGSSKSADWGYEDEVRLLIPNNVSCIRDKHFLRISHESIRSVIFGCLREDETQSKIEKILSFQYLRHVATFRAYTNPTEYKLDIVPIIRAAE